MSIELKLQAILETKAALQAALNLPNSVPFSQYAGRINWKDETPPADLMFADYTKDRYSVSGVPAGFSDVNEFTRLTAATNFVGGELIEYAANKPRIEAGKGLLIEPVATNKVLYSVDANGSAWSKTGLSGTGNTLCETTSNSAHVLQQQLPVNSFQLTDKGSNSMYFKESYDPSRWIAVGISNLSSGNNTTSIQGGAIDSPNGQNIIESQSIQKSSDALALHVGYNQWLGIPIYSKPTIGLLSARTTSGGGAVYAGDTSKCFEFIGSQLELGSYRTSLIKTTTAPATRAPDLLRLTIPAGKTLTLDADAGVTYIMENATTALITATEPGYIRSARVN